MQKKIKVLFYEIFKYLRIWNLISPLRCIFSYRHKRTVIKLFYTRLLLLFSEIHINVT